MSASDDQVSNEKAATHFTRAASKPRMVGLLLCAGLASLDSTALVTAVPSVVGDLGDVRLFHWVVSAYVLASAVTVPVLGNLADLRGRRAMLSGALVMFMISSLLCGTAGDIKSLIAFRVLQGAGAGALTSLTMTWLADLYRGVARARAQTFLSAVYAMSGLGGPIVGGLIAEHSTWRWIFLINLPVGLVAMTLIRRLDDSMVAKRRRADVFGMCLLASGATALLIALGYGGTRQGWEVEQTLLLVAGLVLIAGFVGWEHRSTEPFFPLWMIRSRFLQAVSLVRGIAGVITVGLSLLLPFHAFTVPGTSHADAGIALTVMMVAWPIGSTTSAWLCLRLGCRQTALLGAGSWIAGAAIQAIFPEPIPQPLFLASCAVLGVGVGVVMPATQIGVTTAVDWDRRGTAVGVVMFSQSLGGALGATLVGMVINTSLGAASDQLADRSPPGPDAVMDLLGSGGGDPEVQNLVRQAVANAAGQAFAGIAAVAAVAVVVLITVPWRTQLTGDDDEG